MASLLIKNLFHRKSFNSYISTGHTMPVSRSVISTDVNIQSAQL